MPDFKKIYDEIFEGIKALVKTSVREYEKEALKDAKKFLKDSQADLERWTALLAVGKFTTEDFEWLVESRKDLAVMTFLKQTALAKIRIDKLRDGMINIVIDVIFSRVL
jgi:hypothetical protein